MRTSTVKRNWKFQLFFSRLLPLTTHSNNVNPGSIYINVVFILGFMAGLFAFITWSLPHYRLAHTRKEIYALHAVLLLAALPLAREGKRLLCWGKRRSKGLGKLGSPRWRFHTVFLMLNHANSPSQEAQLKTELQELPKLDRRKKNPPDTKDPVNTAMYIHTYTYPTWFVINTLLSFACADASNVNLSTKDFWLTLNSVLNMEGLSVTWA